MITRTLIALIALLIVSCGDAEPKRNPRPDPPKLCEDGENRVYCLNETTQVDCSEWGNEVTECSECFEDIGSVSCGWVDQ